MGVKNDFFNPPNADEIEISLFGTGGGYGEAVVVKINSTDWIIIDSCQDPISKSPLTVQYLQSLNVNLDNVKFVICTHWHNDHIMGLSKTLNLCSNAKFCIPLVNDRKKFLQFVGLDSLKEIKGSISSYNEFKECLEIMKSRKGSVIKRLGPDNVIYKGKMKLENNLEINTELYSLSPSDSVIANFDLELSTLLSEFNLTKTSVTEKSANAKSVVIYFKYSNYSALLGADLEVVNHPNEGWHDINNNSQVVENKSLIYKIPHHGSENGYSKEIFQNLVEENGILKLSPWNRKDKLPQAEMIKTYKEHSDKVYITSPISLSKKPKKRDKTMDKIAKLFSVKLSEVKFNQGIVRTRHNPSSPKSIKVETFGEAFKV